MTLKVVWGKYLEANVRKEGRKEGRKDGRKDGRKKGMEQGWGGERLLPDVTK